MNFFQYCAGLLTDINEKLRTYVSLHGFSPLVLTLKFSSHSALSDMHQNWYQTHSRNDFKALQLSHSLQQACLLSNLQHQWYKTWRPNNDMQVCVNLISPLAEVLVMAAYEPVSGSDGIRDLSDIILAIGTRCQAEMTFKMSESPDLCPQWLTNVTLAHRGLTRSITNPSPPPHKQRRDTAERYTFVWWNKTQFSPFCLSICLLFIFTHLS